MLLETRGSNTSRFFGKLPNNSFRVPKHWAANTPRFYLLFFVRRVQIGKRRQMQYRFSPLNEDIALSTFSTEVISKPSLRLSGDQSKSSLISSTNLEPINPVNPVAII